MRFPSFSRKRNINTLVTVTVTVILSSALSHIRYSRLRLTKLKDRDVTILINSYDVVWNETVRLQS